jgi:hypothetical protein
MADTSRAIVVTALLNPDPWLIAKERFLASLDDEERILFNEATIENLYYKTSNDARGQRGMRFGFPNQTAETGFRC